MDYLCSSELLLESETSRIVPKLSLFPYSIDSRIVVAGKKLINLQLMKPLSIHCIFVYYFEIKETISRWMHYLASIYCAIFIALFQWENIFPRISILRCIAKRVVDL